MHNWSTLIFKMFVVWLITQKTQLWLVWTLLSHDWLHTQGYRAYPAHVCRRVYVCDVIYSAPDSSVTQLYTYLQSSCLSVVSH